MIGSRLCHEGKAKGKDDAAYKANHQEDSSLHNLKLLLSAEQIKSADQSNEGGAWSPHRRHPDLVGGLSLYFEVI